MDEHGDHLFVKCHFLGRLWPIISIWPGFSTEFQEKLLDHLLQFGVQDGLSKNVWMFLNTIWLYVIWVIWKERNTRNFHNKEKKLQALSETVML